MAWHKTSRHERGYGNAWDKLRKTILQRDNYLCQCENCKGGQLRLTLANEVDHIVSKANASAIGWSIDKTDSLDNLQAINKQCHKIKTASESGKSLKIKHQI